MSDGSQKKTYEEAFIELENLVQYLEKGEISLEESLKAFEKAVELVGFCKSYLTKAEQRIQVLLQDEEGDFRLEDLTFEVEKE